MVEPLFQVLEHKGIKIRWLAQQAGISESLLSRAKKGDRKIPAHARARIAAALGLPESVLFFAQDLTTDKAPVTTDNPRESGSGVEDVA